MPTHQHNFDLEERTFQFALKVRRCIAKHKWPPECWDDTGQLVRASGSVGANYIEANDGLSKADFVFRIRVCKKEAKEARYWSRLLQCTGPEAAREELGEIRQEADELMRIFAKILKNSGAEDYRKTG